MGVVQLFPAFPLRGQGCFAFGRGKERTRNMINAAGLMGLAGLLDKKTGRPLTSPALLLGALVELANRNPTDLEKQSWEQSGAALLAKAKADKD